MGRASFIDRLHSIENINGQLRKIIKTRGHFPSDEAATKLIWLALRNITAGWGHAAHDWKAAMNQFAILYEERFCPAIRVMLNPPRTWKFWQTAPRKTKRRYSRVLYRIRNTVERFFNRIKHFRRVSTRYDKLACNYLAFAVLACAFGPLVRM